MVPTPWMKLPVAALCLSYEVGCEWHRASLPASVSKPQFSVFWTPLTRFLWDKREARQNSVSGKWASFSPKRAIFGSHPTSLSLPIWWMAVPHCLAKPFTRLLMNGLWSNGAYRDWEDGSVFKSTGCSSAQRTQVKLPIPTHGSSQQSVMPILVRSEVFCWPPGHQSHK